MNRYQITDNFIYEAMLHFMEALTAGSIDTSHFTITDRDWFYPGLSAEAKMQSTMDAFQLFNKDPLARKNLDDIVKKRGSTDVLYNFFGLALPQHILRCHSFRITADDLLTNLFEWNDTAELTPPAVDRQDAWEEGERRMANIGSNGNDGDHYPEEDPLPSATDIAQAAVNHMRDRAKTYDKPQGERSIAATVGAFRCVTGIEMTEEQGWLFQVLLKAVRSQQGDYRSDNYEDGTAYFALTGEAAARERNNE